MTTKTTKTNIIADIVVLTFTGMGILLLIIFIIALFILPILTNIALFKYLTT